MTEANQLQKAKEEDNVNCVKCGKIDNVRILLRECGHSCCIEDLLFHLKFWIIDQGKARIKCPMKKCRRRLHENDICAVLDPEERGLDQFMNLEHRQWLQYTHNKHVIAYAFGGDKYVKQCPLCKVLYSKRQGCHYVLCSNQRCNTRFCWQCAQPVTSIAHFGGGKCIIGNQDLPRSVYFFQLMDNSSLCSIIFTFPLVIMMLCIFLPISVFVGIPYCVVKKQWEKITSRTEEITDEERQLFLFKAITLSVCVLPLSISLSLCSLFASIPLLCLYVAFISIWRSTGSISITKTLHIIGKILKKLDCLKRYHSIFGDEEIEEEEERVRNTQKRMERSEYGEQVTTPSLPNTTDGENRKDNEKPIIKPSA